MSSVSLMPCCIKQTAGEGAGEFKKGGLHKIWGLGTLWQLWLLLQLTLHFCFNFSFSKGYAKLQNRIFFQGQDFFTGYLTLQTEWIVVFQSPQLLCKSHRKYGCFATINPTVHKSNIRRVFRLRYYHII